MSSAQLYRRLIELLPSQPELAGDVFSVESDGTAVVTMPGGGRLRARNPIGAVVGDRVFVQGNVITSTGPNLPLELIEI